MPTFLTGHHTLTLTINLLRHNTTQNHTKTSPHYQTRQ